MIDKVSKRQKRLAALMRATSGTIRIEDAINVLKLNRPQATRLLADWHKQGALRRVAHGLYVPVKPSDLGQTQVLEDPWVLVPELYEPGYVGGWSALEHWELTEQIFRSVCVLTNKRTAYGEVKLQGVSFYVKYVPEQYLFGTKSIWKDSIKIKVSDPHKTILDVIGEPELGGGLQHVFDCFQEYSKIYKNSERSKLLEYAERLGNGALFKKLGYLAELANFEESFLNFCRKHLTEGYASLDRDIQNRKLVTRWKLWVPESWK